ncbi:PREDICTED: CD63 antigen-like [Dinoponera quadriceps]|uniref:CD63 antigen-like n=1 Tax=Dinoponera quadriceps TaxID=609295 RepID=A0A6P3XR93_DINQU|nr:PREDICTED: CD63 antigen-like [Dinoponera quadriceps]
MCADLSSCTCARGGTRPSTKMAATHLDVGLRCIKYLLCAVNSLFVLTGVMIISVGTTIYAVYESFSHFLDPSYFSPATLLIVVGILVFIIAFMGCCGALRESTCMVLVFAVSLSIVLLLELSAAVAAYALQGNIKGLLAEKINATMHQYGTNDEARFALDFMQSRLHCCGYNGPNDWTSISLNNTQPMDSCCEYITLNIGEEVCPEEERYQEGCIGRLSIIIHRSALYIGTGAVAIALIQLTGIMFACMLGRAIRRQKTERERRRWELRENLVNGYEPLGKSDPLTTFPVVYMSPEYPLNSDKKC